MKSYIFVTCEGFTYEPGGDDIGGEVENCQVIGFGQGGDENEAFDNMVKENEGLLETSFDKIVCFELKHVDYWKEAKGFSLEELSV
jgi:hypothetical protein